MQRGQKIKSPRDTNSFLGSDSQRLSMNSAVTRLPPGVIKRNERIIVDEPFHLCIDSSETAPARFIAWHKGTFWGRAGGRPGTGATGKDWRPSRWKHRTSMGSTSSIRRGGQGCCRARAGGRGVDCGGRLACFLEGCGGGRSPRMNHIGRFRRGIGPGVAALDLARFLQHTVSFLRPEPLAVDARSTSCHPLAVECHPLAVE
jgi:hypothetical protein